MTQQEFEERSKTYPTAALWEVIEEYYIAHEEEYDGEQDFCDAYMLNDGGIAQEIRQIADETARCVEIGHKQALERSNGIIRQVTEERDAALRKLREYEVFLNIVAGFARQMKEE